jgi:putative endonuclease
MPATAAQVLEARAERLAMEYLQGRRLTSGERNDRRRLGEIDRVALDNGVLVSAEVRTCSSEGFGGAAARVDGRKQRRIIRSRRSCCSETGARRRCRCGLMY